MFVTHPLDRQTGCVLSRRIDVPAGKKTSLRAVVANDDRGDWTLLVVIEGEPALRRKIGPDTVTDGWAEVVVDLSQHAGKSIAVELVNQADDWRFEAGYWTEIVVESE